MKLPAQDSPGIKTKGSIIGRTEENLDRTDKTSKDQISSLTPTQTLCFELQGAYTYYNRALFDGELPECMLTLDQTGKTRLGYFKPDSFLSKDGDFIHEIALSAVYILSKDIPDVLSTLVHEMCHLSLWEISEKKPSGGYHCKHFAALMESVGLITSDTGAPGGKRTGHRMSDYILPDGPFDQATEVLLKGQFSITWGLATKEIRSAQLAETMGAPDLSEAKDKSKGKVRFACPLCEKPAWAASSRLLICGDCNVKLVVGA